MVKLSIMKKDQLTIAKREVYRLLKIYLNRKFYSQATQDLFVLQMLGNKKNGFYVEIGSGPPSDSNNTYMLEREFGWGGVSVEYDKNLVEFYNAQRKNKSILGDATKLDYFAIFNEMNFPSQIDYLSLDIEPAINTLKALRLLPHKEYRFSVITFEHDHYRWGDGVMLESRKFLRNIGYELVVSNLNVFGRDFEDWWIDPTIVDKKIWMPFVRRDVEFSSIWASQKR